MVSGYGYNGGPSRCFGEWQRYLDCYTAAATNKPSECLPNLEDYFECLHHIKERKRAQTIQQELRKLEEEGSPVLPVKQTTPVEGLGLIPK